MKRIVIIDDEPDARQALKTLIARLCPEAEVIGEADGVQSGFVLIRQCKPQAVLLDISMEDGSGFDLLDKFPKPDFQVIFTTAHDDFALRAFRYHALDYLLKPINPTELAQAIDRLEPALPADYSERILHLLESNKTQKLENITLSTQEGIVFLALNQIIRLESDGSYTTFILPNGERHLVSRPMRDFEALLPEANFCKVHQSHIINLSFVKKLLKEDGGYAQMADGSLVPIARRRKEDFIHAIRVWSG
jgi:two-component system LytT family response regulator